MIVPSPIAAQKDQISEPVVMPEASAKPCFLPDAIDVPAIASVAGPGLALATNAASRMRGMLMSIIMGRVSLRSCIEDTFARADRLINASFGKTAVTGRLQQ